MSNLSGKEWWRRNQDLYPNSRDTDDLEPGFRSRVELFIKSLRQAGATVAVSSTLRHPVRAHLMHYSWKVAHGDVDPKDVPPKPGLQIEWDHGDLKTSRKAAAEMVILFDMAHVAALTSNHIRGKAIDMTISWKGKKELVLINPAPLYYKIQSRPRNGQNLELHEVGASVFGVRKLKSDPPHWSADGK